MGSILAPSRRLLLAGVLWSVSGPLLSAEPAPAGVDFAFQGEFVTESNDPCDPARAGLQVVARGNGRFDAVVLPGGLPGAGWNRSQRFQLAGEWDESAGAVMLRGKEYGASVTPRHAQLRDRQGKLVSLRRIVRTSPTLGAAPPRSAVVLFRQGQPDVGRHLEAARLTNEGWLGPGFSTRKAVEDFHLHVEFRTPFMPQASGQGRGNSGVYIQRRYEVQILDSFGLSGEANECGALYKQRPPLVNMCLPPRTWQTYDIYFTAARWSPDGRKMAPARVTVVHNGVAVQDNVAIAGKTGAGQPESPAPLPILFQDHNDPVEFRNIWIAPGACHRGDCRCRR